MKALINYMVALVFITCCGRHEKKTVATLPQKIDSVMHLVPDFSGVVLVAEKGKRVYHKAFGYANVESGKLMDTTSIFELASLSKQFTAMCVALLHEEGKLSYDDALEKYLPGLPYPGVTIRHLLNHTSGVPDYQQLMDAVWDKSKVAGNEDIIAYLKKFHPPSLSKPADKYQYSNTGYVLLASIVEKTSGRDFVAYCHERIFDPLGMTRIDIRARETKDTISNFALGYIFAGEKKRYVRADSFPLSNYTIWLGKRKGPGRVSATTTDLLQWDRALYTEKIVNKKTLADMFSPAKLNDGSASPYGFGWSLSTDARLGKIVSHTGDNPGYKTVILRYIEKDKTVIVLCNNAHEKFNILVRQIRNLLPAD